MEILEHRDTCNPLTSVLFMSDGEDTCDNGHESVISAIKERDYWLSKKNMNYQIHCFGFGENHDDKLLTKMAQSKTGNFYYIKNQELIQECYISCMNYVLTVIAERASIKIFSG